MERRTQTVETVTTGIAGGRVFDAALYRDPDGRPTDPILSVGFASEPARLDRASALRLPAGALPAILDALNAIGVGGAS